MIPGLFDVVVLGFRLHAPDTPVSALARIVGVDDARARALSAAFPCPVLEGVSYARAESTAASLQLAGAHAKVVAHGADATYALVAARVQPPAPMPVVAEPVLRRVETTPEAPPQPVRGKSVHPAHAVVVSSRPPAPALRMASARPAPLVVVPWCESVDTASSAADAAAPSASAAKPHGELASARTELSLELPSLDDLADQIAKAAAADEQREQAKAKQPQPGALARISRGMSRVWRGRTQVEDLESMLSYPVRTADRAGTPLAMGGDATGPMASAPRAFRRPHPTDASVPVVSDAGDAITPRTLWLLAVLWLSVALLIWLRF